MDQTQKFFLIERQKDVIRQSPCLKPLHDKLLSIGGKFTCLPVVEEDLKNILNFGVCISGKKSRMRKMSPSQCHLNVCDLYLESKKKIKIMTGYALSEDTIWRQHSWGIDENGLVIETTVKRVKYFGFVMNDKQAQEFCWENF